MSTKGGGENVGRGKHPEKKYPFVRDGIGVVHKSRHAILRKNLPPSPFVTLCHTFLDPPSNMTSQTSTPLPGSR